MDTPTAKPQPKRPPDLTIPHIFRHYGDTPQEISASISKLCRQYNKLTGRYLFLHAASKYKRGPEIALDQDDYYNVFNILRVIPDKKLDYYIETPGGSGNAAEEIVKFLRSRFDEVNFVISGEAKSAGTIMALSGDEIMMTETGSLGPIDAQISIGRRFDSAHDYLEWVKEKYEDAKNTGRLNAFDAVIISKINPGELRGIEHAYAYAKDLVRSWLPKYKFKNWTVTETTQTPVTDEMKVKVAEKIADDLCNHGLWRDHGRSLKVSQLLEIGLKVKLIDDKSEMAEIIYNIQTAIRMYFVISGASKLYASGHGMYAMGSGSEAEQNSSSRSKIDVLEVEFTCVHCGAKTGFYAKSEASKEVDAKCQADGLKPFPLNSVFNCPGCNKRNDMHEMKKGIEKQLGKPLK